MAELDDAAGDAASVAAGRSGWIRVGFVSSASYATIPEVIWSFRSSGHGLNCFRIPRNYFTCWIIFPNGVARSAVIADTNRTRTMVSVER